MPAPVDSPDRTRSTSKDPAHRETGLFKEDFQTRRKRWRQRCMSARLPTN